MRNLLDFSGTASFFKLLLDVFCFVLRSTFLDGRRRAVDQALGFFQAKTGYRANNLDDVDFLLASGGQNNVELGLLFCSSTCVTAGSGGESASRDAADRTAAGGDDKGGGVDKVAEGPTVEEVRAQAAAEQDAMAREHSDEMQAIQLELTTVKMRLLENRVKSGLLDDIL